MVGKRTSDVAKKYLDKAEQDMLELHQQFKEAAKNYEDMKCAYHYSLACEKNPFK